MTFRFHNWRTRWMFGILLDANSIFLYFFHFTLGIERKGRDRYAD